MSAATLGCRYFKAFFPVRTSARLRHIRATQYTPAEVRDHLVTDGPIGAVAAPSNCVGCRAQDGQQLLRARTQPVESRQLQHKAYSLTPRGAQRSRGGPQATPSTVRLGFASLTAGSPAAGEGLVPNRCGMLPTTQTPGSRSPGRSCLFPRTRGGDSRPLGRLELDRGGDGIDRRAI